MIQYMTHYTWHMISETWHMTHDTWQNTHDTSHKTQYTWHMTHTTWQMTHDTWCMAHETWHMTCDTRDMTHDTWHFMHDTCYMTHVNDIRHMKNYSWQMPMTHDMCQSHMTLVYREDKTGELRLNFDEGFYSLLNENEKLMKLDIPLPSINQFLVKQKTWFYEYRSRIQARI